MLLAVRAHAADAPPVLDAGLLADSDAITIDGRLDEPAWARVAPAADFRQMEPDNGAPATERTEVRILYDRHRLILGISCFDSDPGRVLGNQLQRDQTFAGDDRFMVSLDTFADGRSGYYFEINPAGAMGDGLIIPGGVASANGSVNRSWDGIWIARVTRTEVGWSAEIELPFRTLNFDRSKCERMGNQFPAERAPQERRNALDRLRSQRGDHLYGGGRPPRLGIEIRDPGLGIRDSGLGIREWGVGTRIRN